MYVDESSLTGESISVGKLPGDEGLKSSNVVQLNEQIIDDATIEPHEEENYPAIQALRQNIQVIDGQLNNLRRNRPPPRRNSIRFRAEITRLERLKHDMEREISRLSINS